MTKRKVVQPDLIDLLLADYQKPDDLIGENGILKRLTKAIWSVHCKPGLLPTEVSRQALCQRQQQHAQRQQCQDAQGELWRLTHRYSARPQWQLRAAAHCET
jgi:hypothetical protein